MYNASITGFKYPPLNTYKKDTTFTGRSIQGTLRIGRGKQRYLSGGQKKIFWKRACLLISGLVIAGLLAKGGNVKGIKNIDFKHILPETKISEKSGEFKFDKVNLEGFTEYIKVDPAVIEESVNKPVQKSSISEKVSKIIAPDASAEIKALKNKTYTEKNNRLYNLYEKDEYNPQLKEYLLSCRMEHLNKNLKPEWAQMIKDNCKENGFNTQEDIINLLAQMLQESAFNPNALSGVGAVGLGQIMPGTAADLNKMLVRKIDIKKIPDNIRGFVIINAQNSQHYNNCNKRKTLPAAYNAGTGAVDAYMNGISIKTNKRTINPNKKITEDGVPPYKETEQHVKIVNGDIEYIFEHLDDLDPNLRACLGLEQNETNWFNQAINKIRGNK